MEVDRHVLHQVLLECSVDVQICRVGDREQLLFVTVSDEVVALRSGLERA